MKIVIRNGYVFKQFAVNIVLILMKYKHSIISRENKDHMYQINIANTLTMTV